MKRLPRSLLWLIGAFFLILLVCLISLQTTNRFQSPEPKYQAQSTVLAACEALHKYYQSYGLALVGDQRMIFQILQGDNPRKIVFISFHKEDMDRQGYFVDPWGSPYRIDVSDPKNPRVWSPGKNKKDEPDDPHSDDICSWR